MSTYRIETGKDDYGKIYADILRNGRHWKRIAGNGERPFETTAEASKYARDVVKRNQ